jgi:hypothetical protein
MTHEPIHTVHLTPHITWQGTQEELDAMLAEGWPMGSASEIIAACKRDAAEAVAYAAELERNILAAEERLKLLVKWLDVSDEELSTLPLASVIDDHRYIQIEVNAAFAALKGDDDE